MPDVPLYTAVISGCAAVVGAAIPTAASTIQNILAARRDRQDRHETDQRQACVDLVQAAEYLRTQVADNHDYHGDEMAARLAQVRAFAAQARIQAVRISLAVPPELAQVAEELATAPRKLAEAAEARTDLRQGVSTELLTSVTSTRASPPSKQRQCTSRRSPGRESLVISTTDAVALDWADIG